MKLSIVVCVRNQRDTILSTLDRLWTVAANGWEIEVVVVDSHSTDGTRDLLRSLDTANLQVIYQPQWQQRGACWRAALPHLSGDYVLFRANPTGPALADLDSLLASVEDNSVAIYSAPPVDEGARFKRDAVTRLLNTLFDGDLSDVLGASKLVQAAILKALNLSGSGMGLEIDLTIKLLRAGLEIRQVPTETQAQLSKIGRRERLAALGAVLSARLDPSPVWKPGQRPTQWSQR
jgi:glycosyltransferase involved in cell wall biosynthesis